MTAQTHELIAALERTIGKPVIDVRRTPSPYAASYALEELVVQPAGEPALELMFKDLGAPSATARAIKPSFVVDPLREIEVYTELLPGSHMSTARCWGASIDPSRGRYWLFLERIRGVELYQVGERAAWEVVARWLAGMHRALARRSPGRRLLLRYDAELLTRWAYRAFEYAPARHRHRLGEIAARYDSVLEMMLAAPPTPIHGEFYASNVLVDDARSPSRVCPVDWEMAALGPPLIDLAALVSGAWSTSDRDAIASAYRSALPPAERPDDGEFRIALDACRLHLALQWIGWSERWSPPAEHATDWLSSALDAAASLGL
jgi:aminoglycoside phosphotransferase (APT) family kinase protein